MKKIITLIFLFSAIVLPLSNAQAENVFKPLIGSWIRPDGGYILLINDVKENGDIDAAYLNPRSINVSSARASISENNINIRVELKDKYYPGNYYTLTYVPKADQLVGVYHHLGTDQNFDVFFVRE